MYQFAIIGCGEVAHWHAAEIRSIGQIAAICDTNTEKAFTFQKQYGGKFYSSIDDLLTNEKELDIIVICSPTGMHAEHAIKSLQARKHVVCERPLCITNPAAWQIIETARLCRRKLAIVSTHNDSVEYHKLSSITESGELGKPISFHFIATASMDSNSTEGWKTKSFPGGNTLLVYFHDQLELLNRLFGNISRASTFLSNNSVDTEDFEIAGTSSFNTTAGVLGSISWNLGKDKEPMCILHINFEKETLSFYDLYLKNANEDLKSVYKNLYSDLGKNFTETTIHGTDPSDINVIGFIEKIYSSVYKPEEQ